MLSKSLSWNNLNHYIFFYIIHPISIYKSTNHLFASWTQILLNPTHLYIVLFHLLKFLYKDKQVAIPCGGKLKRLAPHEYKTNNSPSYSRHRRSLFKKYSSLCLRRALRAHFTTVKLKVMQLRPLKSRFGFLLFLLAMLFGRGISNLMSWLFSPR